MFASWLLHCINRREINQAVVSFIRQTGTPAQTVTIVVVVNCVCSMYLYVCVCVCVCECVPISPNALFSVVIAHGL